MNQNIETGTYTYIKTWFDDFVISFENQYPQFLSQFNLKRVHSQNVADEIFEGSGSF
jgi:hypothetical protein